MFFKSLSVMKPMKILMPFILTACVLSLTAMECGANLDDDRYFRVTIDSKQYETEGRPYGMNWDMWSRMKKDSIILKMTNLKYQGEYFEDSLRVTEPILALYLNDNSVIEPGIKYNIGDEGVEIEFSFISGYYRNKFDIHWMMDERTYASKGWIEFSLYDEDHAEGEFFFEDMEFLIFDPEKRDGEYHTATFDVAGSFYR